MDELEGLRLELDSRGLSRKTKKSYLFFVGDFLAYAHKNPSLIHEEDIKKYVAHLIAEKGYTNVTANVAISALKFYFSKVLKSSVCDGIERPRREKTLPTVLSKEEVKRVIESAGNVKHRLVLSACTVWGSGSRKSLN